MTDEYTRKRDAAAEENNAHLKSVKRVEWTGMSAWARCVNAFKAGADWGRAEMQAERDAALCAIKTVQNIIGLWTVGSGSVSQVFRDAFNVNASLLTKQGKGGACEHKLEVERLAEAKSNSVSRDYFNANVDALKVTSKALREENERLTAIIGTDRMDDWRRIQDAERECERLKVELEESNRQREEHFQAKRRAAEEIEKLKAENESNREMFEAVADERNRARVERDAALAMAERLAGALEWYGRGFSRTEGKSMADENLDDFGKRARAACAEYAAFKKEGK